jgi:hypothetical protein
MTQGPQLDQLLQGLGGSADAVAATLRAAGIQGVRNTVRFLNPVVRYLQGQLRADASMDLIEPGKVRLRYGDGSREEAVLPAAVCQFLDAFNQGAYPELHLPPEPT